MNELTNCMSMQWSNIQKLKRTNEGFPGRLGGKEFACQYRRHGFVWSLHWENPLEKEMTAHSSILAWEIPCTEEPGGLQSMGSQRVRHNWSDWACWRTSVLDVYYLLVSVTPAYRCCQRIMPFLSSNDHLLLVEFNWNPAVWFQSLVSNLSSSAG